MNDSGAVKLKRMREDFRSVTGTSFAWFYCPILFRDEDVDLCKAHIVNRAFVSTPRSWTVQRADVDNFYGSFFEAEFVDIQHEGKASVDQCLTDKELAKKFRPDIRLRGDSVDYYVARANVPAGHSRIVLQTNVGNVELGLKVSPDEVAAAGSEDWQITIEKDLRIPALASLLKAAHLTLFEMLGYRYGLSAAGHFVGSTILGKFFSENREKNRAEVIANAAEHFAEFKNMVRPVVSDTPMLEGTAVDNRLYICETTAAIPWAFIIFVRTFPTKHAVLVPVFEHADSAARFVAFLKGEGGHVEAKFCMYANGAFSAAAKTTPFWWPKADLS
jgi:hypothetical protein